MLRFLVIRHGETISNAENRFSGHQDVGLTEKGVWQAEQLSHRLKEEQIDVAYSSDLKRAIHTAKIILQNHELALKTEPLFKELSFGDWEGLQYKELNFDKGEQLMEWWNHPDLPLPGGESTFDLRERVINGLNQLIERHYEEEQKKTIAIICHGGVSRIIIGIALDIPIKKIWHIKQYSTALNVIRYYQKSGYFVESINDVNHLKINQKKEEALEK